MCTRNRPEDLRRVLASLAWQTVRCSQILVIDDSDPTMRGVSEAACVFSDPPAELHRKDEPGLTASRNLAIGLSNGEITVFFDDDVVLRPDYLERIADSFAHDPDLVGAGGSVDDDHLYGWTLVRRLLMVPGKPTGKVYRSGWSTPLPRGESGTVHHLIGCNMAYRTEVLRQYRFDDTFRGYALGEDLEFSHRLHLDGHRLVCVGSARLWHLTALPRADRAWGYREMVIRPQVAGRRFSRVAFLISSSSFLLVNLLKNRERAAGNLAGMRDVMLGRPPRDLQTLRKAIR